MIQNSVSSDRPVSVVIVGAGHRGLLYASYAVDHPEELQIVGVVDPIKFRREQARELHNSPVENSWESVDEFLQHPQMADAVINATMDHLHVETSIPILKAGYHLLLEKPIAVDEESLLQLLKVARDTERKVMICHVLRYAPFYAEIKRQILAGAVGEIINIQTAEHVSYHHLSASYIRGKWNSKEKCHSTMLMAKCCHDLDILTWLKSGYPPVKVNSFGSRMYFRKEKAPERSGTRCLVDCPIEEECLYSAKKIYLDHPDRWAFYVWSFIEHLDNPTREDMIESLKTDNPHGRCIWKCDNDVVDHQSVVLQFADGSTATHNMVGGTARPCRKIHILGSKGEIEGVMEDGQITLRYPDLRPGNEYREEIIEIDVVNDGHGGGDMRLMEDFVQVIRGEEPSISTTNIEDSIYGHLLGFRADKSMDTDQVVEV